MFDPREGLKFCQDYPFLNVAKKTLYAACPSIFLLLLENYIFFHQLHLSYNAKTFISI